MICGFERFSVRKIHLQDVGLFLTRKTIYNYKENASVKLHKNLCLQHLKFVKYFLNYFCKKTCNLPINKVKYKGCDMAYEEVGGCRK